MGLPVTGLVGRIPVPGVRFGVVGRVVGHRVSVAGGVELEGVVDSGVIERAFQQLSLAGGERVVFPRAGHIQGTGSITGLGEDAASPARSSHCGPCSIDAR